MQEVVGTSLDRSNVQRACDACKVKKIRCSRTVPCSNCRASKSICRRVELPPKPQKQRIHVSEEYEKKITRLESRLNSIDDTLLRIASRLDGKDRTVRSEEETSEAVCPSTQRASKGFSRETEVSASSPYEGETGISAQSNYVRDLLIHAVGNTPSVNQKADVKELLTALESLVAQQNLDPVPITSTIRPLVDRSLAKFDIENLPVPPWNTVRIALDKATKHPTMIFAVLLSMLKLENLYVIIEDSYNHPMACGAPRRLLTYGVLFNIFTEFSVVPWDGVESTTLLEYASMARTHLEIAISQLDMFLPASYENITALSLGTACAVEMCKPSLARVLIANAAEMCKTLGYHRFETMKRDTEQERSSKLRVFWMVFMFDKQLSLRLGRVSTIQDWDVSLPPLAAKDTPVDSFEENDMIVYWVKVAKVQGQVYEKLFNPATFAQSPTMRAQTVHDLVDAMNQAWNERGFSIAADFANRMGPNETELPSKRKRILQEASQTALRPDEYMQRSFDRIEDVFFHTDVVVHYSTCALVLRALSPDNKTFDEECLKYSRAALVAHMRCNAQFNTKGNTELWSGYIHWSILQAPITPFMALFCNAIHNADRTDMKSLAGFVSSLESCRTVSEGAESLYKMCLLFLKIADFYIQAKEEEIRDTQTQMAIHQEHYRTNEPAVPTSEYHNTIAQFDPHLSALGLASNLAVPMTDYFGNPTSQGQNHYVPGQMPENLSYLQSEDLGYGTMNATHNPVQDCFLGPRFFIDFMDLDRNLQMPDIRDGYFY